MRRWADAIMAGNLRAEGRARQAELNPQVIRRQQHRPNKVSEMQSAEVMPRRSQRFVQEELDRRCTRS